VPVKSVIESDRDKVMAELEKRPFKDELSSKFQQGFRDLLKRLESCHNFYEAIAMKEESDRLKLRCFEEIEKKSRELEKEPGKIEPEPKKVINISLANIFHGARTLETEEDVEQLLGYLRERLLKELQENTKLKLV
jgi:hypothetical protein